MVAVYYVAYHELTVNIFALSSTWLTVVMAVSRYVVVCRPLHARGYISLHRTRCALLAVFLLSAVVNVYQLSQSSVMTLECSPLLNLTSNNQTDRCNCLLYTAVNIDERIQLST